MFSSKTGDDQMKDVLQGKNIDNQKNSGISVFLFELNKFEMMKLSHDKILCILKKNYMYYEMASVNMNAI